MTEGSPQDTMTEAEAMQRARARIEADLDRTESLLAEATANHDKWVAISRETNFFWWLAAASIVVGFITGWIGGYMEGHLAGLVQVTFAQ